MKEMLESLTLQQALGSLKRSKAGETVEGIAPLVDAVLADSRFAALDPRVVAGLVKREAAGLAAHSKANEVQFVVDSMLNQLNPTSFNNLIQTAAQRTAAPVAPPRAASASGSSHASGGAHNTTVRTRPGLTSLRLSNLKEIESAAAVSSGISFLIAGLSAAGAWSSLRQGIQRDDQGNTHLNTSALGAGAVQLLLAAGITYLGVKTLHEAMPQTHTR